MAETDLSDWLPIADAAVRIGCSTRTIERLARAKKLEQRLRAQAGSPAVAVYNPADVARLAAERQPTPPPFVLPAVPDPSNRNGKGRGQSLKESSGSFLQALPVGDDPIEQLAAAFRAFLLSPPRLPPSPPPSQLAETVADTPWIDLPTAAAILGRSQAYVRKQIKAGRLVAERDRCLLVRRKDVEAL